MDVVALTKHAFPFFCSNHKKLGFASSLAQELKLG